MDLTETAVKKRAPSDRRILSWKTVLFGFLRSRRLLLRREADADFQFLDWHHPWIFFLAVGTMILSCADAFMTLQLLEHGMIEANPVMAAVLGKSTTVFAVSKMTMTGLGLLALVFLAKARFLNRFRTGLLLTVCFSAYACLVCYEFVQLLKVL
jgi:hypothetical protein